MLETSAALTLERCSNGKFGSTSFAPSEGQLLAGALPTYSSSSHGSLGSEELLDGQTSCPDRLGSLRSPSRGGVCDSGPSSLDAAVLAAIWSSSGWSHRSESLWGREGI